MDDLVIYTVWHVDADSYNGRSYFLEAHMTLEGAIESIPERFRRDTDREPEWENETKVRDYRYYQIKVIPLMD